MLIQIGSLWHCAGSLWTLKQLHLLSFYSPGHTISTLHYVP